MARIVKTREKSKRRKVLSFNDYENNLDGMSKIQRDLQNSLRPNIFEITSMTQLLFESLKRLRPYNKTVKNEMGSINREICKLLTERGLLDNNVTVTKLTDKGEILIKNKDEDPIELFQLWVLGYNKVPSTQLFQIKPNVKRDLIYINDLVKDYEEHKEVINFQNQKNNKRDHRTKTIIDFYTRCLQQRQLILDYYLNGVYERAINKSKSHFFNMFGMNDWFEHFKDYPYETAKTWFPRSFNYRNIDCVSHRINDLSVRELPSYFSLYSKNKEKFYKLLFKRKTPDQIFQNINFNLKYIPLSKDRKAIFKELKRLFKSKKWLTFYALALPQVEGLFAEMVMTANPDKNISNSLSEKVKAVRPDYGLSNSYFDYYEYVVPVQRNKFSHTGFGEDFKLKAFDLLIDLDHILTVFVELENPFVKVSRIIKMQNPMNFVKVEDFVNYFNLLSNLHKNQLIEKKIELLHFHERFLKQNCQIEYIIQESISELEKAFSELQMQFEFEFSDFKIHYDFSKWKQILVENKSNEVFIEKVNDVFVHYSENIESVLKINFFFLGLKKYIYIKKIIPIELENSFKAFENKKEFIQGLLLLEKIQLPPEK